MNQRKTQAAKKWLRSVVSGEFTYVIQGTRNHAQQIEAYIAELETIRVKYNEILSSRKLLAARKPSPPPCPGGCGGTGEILDDRGCYERMCSVCRGGVRP
jgi:hypothetical protein